MTTPPTSLRARLSSGEFLLVPGAADALTARVIEDIGFSAVYVTGAGITNSSYGLPDLGFISLDHLVRTVASMREVVSLPLIVDADTGFGGPLQTARTVKLLEMAGADAIQIEDQVSPKRCGHFDNKEVIAQGQMIGKLKAALDSRSSEELLLIARTDARQQFGLSEACERAQAYREVGADMIFLEAPQSADELKTVGALGGLQIANMVEGGATPIVSAAQLGEYGFSMALYANSTLRAAIWNMREVLVHLRDQGSTIGFTNMASWTERQRLVRTSEFEELEGRYLDDSEVIAL